MKIISIMLWGAGDISEKLPRHRLYNNVRFEEFKQGERENKRERQT